VGNVLRPFLIALVGFLVLDGLWLGVVMGSYYRVALGPMARTAPDGSLAPIWTVALPVYVLLALGEVWFVAPRGASGSLVAAIGWGAAFGCVTYGVYDLTNWSTLKDYTAGLALIDIAWGTFACATVAAALKLWGRA
jgi:uncharacterized membrane protein